MAAGGWGADGATQCLPQPRFTGARIYSARPSGPPSRPHSCPLPLACTAGITHPCEGCFGVTPSAGEEPGRQIPSIQGAGPLGRPALDVEFGTPLQPSPAWFPMPQTSRAHRPGEAGLDHSQTLRGGLVPHKWPSSLRWEQGGVGSGSRRGHLLEPETCAGREAEGGASATGCGPSSSESGSTCTETLLGSDPEAHSAARAQAPPAEPNLSSCTKAGLTAPCRRALSPAPRPSRGRAGASAVRCGSAAAVAAPHPCHCCHCPVQSLAHPRASGA